jgi:SWI/SNF-related matrix-associated actin-dependent regulator of chromatin subfamily A member 5
MAQTDLDSMNIDAILEQSEVWKTSDAAEATVKDSEDSDLAGSLLSCLESCAALRSMNEYDGVVYKRGARKPNKVLDIADIESIAAMPKSKRVTQARVVSVDDGDGGTHSVLKWSIEEEEAANTKPQGSGCTKQAKEKKFTHELKCLKCSKVPDSDSNREELEGQAVLCQMCPRMMHRRCLDANNQSERIGWMCPQHHCIQCRKSAAQAGGLLFRCISCPITFCPACLPLSFQAQDGCGDLAELGYNPPSSVVYIRHSGEHGAMWDDACVRSAQGDFEREEQCVQWKLQSALLDSDEDSNGYENSGTDESESEGSDGEMDEDD